MGEIPTESAQYYICCFQVEFGEELYTIWLPNVCTKQDFQDTVVVNCGRRKHDIAPIFLKLMMPVPVRALLFDQCVVTSVRRDPTTPHETFYLLPVLFYLSKVKISRYLLKKIHLLELMHEKFALITVLKLLSIFVTNIIH